MVRGHVFGPDGPVWKARKPSKRPTPENHDTVETTNLSGKRGVRSHLWELYRFVAALFVLVRIGFRNSWVRCDIGVVFKQPKNCIYSCGIFYLDLVFRWSAVFISPLLICFHFWCEKGLGQPLLPIFYLFLMMWKCCCIGTFIYKMLSSNTRLIELWNRNPRGEIENFRH